RRFPKAFHRGVDRRRRRWCAPDGDCRRERRRARARGATVPRARRQAKPSGARRRMGGPERGSRGAQRVSDVIDQFRVLRPGWRDALEIAVASYGIYRVLLALHRRRAMQILVGIVVVIVTYT